MPDSSSKSMSWKPAYGAVSVSNLPEASQSKRPESTSTPPMATPWPPRNLVAEWYSRSAPSSNGFIRYGVVNVASTSSGTLACVRDLGDRRDVEHVEAGIAERFAEQQPRVFGRIGFLPVVRDSGR